MQHTYDNASLHIVIAIASIAVFDLALLLVRSQDTIENVSWMKAVIPHHSIEILTSRRAHISDSRVRKLDAGTIAAQDREIGDQRTHLADLEKRVK
jgi:uncharacterized protein (DUF305 family)